MSMSKFRGVRPQLAQRPDNRWVASALAFWEEHGAVVEIQLSWEHGKDFVTPEEAAGYAYQQGTLWLDKEHPQK